MPLKTNFCTTGFSSTKISIIWLSNETFTFLKKLVEYSSLTISFKSSLLISSLILTFENKIIVESEILLLPVILNSFMASANEMVLIKNINSVIFIINFIIFLILYIDF